MKKWLLMTVVLAMAVPAMAQSLGLPIASTAEAPAAGAMQASAGIAIGDDINMYGGRFTYGVMDGLAVFGDVGILSPSGGDNGTGFQIGALYAIDLPDLPVDLAARAAFGMASFDEKFDGGKIDVDYTIINVGALISKPFDQFTAYAYLGLHWGKVEVEMRSGGEKYSGSDSETDPAFGAGVIYTLNENLSFYGEIMIIDDPWFNIGARWSFSR